MSARKLTPFAGATRAQDGLSVTAIDLDSGKVRSFHRSGAALGKRGAISVGVLDVLREIAADLDARPGRWRIRSLSSPTSILNDLRRGGTDPPYEAELLGKIQRLDLLERPVSSRRALRAMRVQALRNEDGSR